MNIAYRYLSGLPVAQATELTLTAITGAACNSGEHSLELAELLGDALLKFAASVQVYLARYARCKSHRVTLLSINRLSQLFTASEFLAWSDHDFYLEMMSS